MALVFKIKFQETLRRWLVTEDHDPAVFSLTMSQLEDKIREFFELPLSASLVITYVDKDKDVVTLGHDQDLVDACVVQELNPLRLDVQVSDANRSASAYANEKGALPRALAGSIRNGPDVPVLPETDKGRGGLVAGTHIKRLLSNLKPALPYAPPLPSVRPHRGVQCDGCGMNPIEGPRFRSIKVPDYDLCARCYDLMGHETEFEKLEHPVFTPFRRLGFFRRTPRFVGVSSSTASSLYGWKPECPFSGQLLEFSASNDNHKSLSARFVKDVTIPDGTKLRPGTKFTKIWRMTNDGTVSWPQGTQLVHIGGDWLCSLGVVNLELPQRGVSCGNDVDISVDLTAPCVVGHYSSHWRLVSPPGRKFGHRVWVVVHVVSDSQLSSPSQGDDEDSAMSEAEIQGHSSGELDGGKGTLSGPGDAHDKKVSSVSVMIEQAGDSQGGKQLEECFVSEVIQDLNVLGDENAINMMARLEDGHGLCGDQEKLAVEEAEEDVELDGFSVVNKPAVCGADEGRLDQERELHVLESMGFNNRSRNILLLKKNNGSLQRTAEDLSHCARWEGVMKNLTAMGFDDEAVVLPLLFKHNGSIKMVVKDLVQMESGGGNGAK